MPDLACGPKMRQTEDRDRDPDGFGGSAGSDCTAGFLASDGAGVNGRRRRLGHLCGRLPMDSESALRRAPERPENDHSVGRIRRDGRRCGRNRACVASDADRSIEGPTRET